MGSTIFQYHLQLEYYHSEAGLNVPWSSLNSQVNILLRVNTSPFSAAQYVLEFA